MLLVIAFGVLICDSEEMTATPWFFFPGGMERCQAFVGPLAGGVHSQWPGQCWMLRFVRLFSFSPSHICLWSSCICDWDRLLSSSQIQHRDSKSKVRTGASHKDGSVMLSSFSCFCPN